MCSVQCALCTVDFALCSSIECIAKMLLQGGGLFALGRKATLSLILSLAIQEEVMEDNRGKENYMEIAINWRRILIN